MRFLFILLYFLLAFKARTQGIGAVPDTVKGRDSLIFDLLRGVPDGVYITYESFKNNRPILKHQIVSTNDKQSPGFIARSLSSGRLKYLVDQDTVTLTSLTFWGFLENNTLYLNNSNGKYCRVILFGTLSSFVERVEASDLAFDNVNQSGVIISSGKIHPVSGIVSVDGMLQYLINLRNNEVLEYNLSNFKKLISDDKPLSYSFDLKSKKEQKKQIHSYLRRYNELHPFYVPKN